MNKRLSSSAKMTKTERLSMMRTLRLLKEMLPRWELQKDKIKKYGVTVTAIVLAAGVTIGAVIGAITNALKSMGKALGNGLTEIGKKNSLPPSRTNWPDCFFSFQSCWPGHWFSG